MLRRVRDFAEVEGDGTIDEKQAKSALTRLEIDEDGLDKMDRKILETIAIKFSGGPVGLDTIAHAIGESPDTVEDTNEPYLIQQGFLARTPRGRAAQPLAYRHFGLTTPTRLQNQELFGE